MGVEILPKISFRVPLSEPLDELCGDGWGDFGELAESWCGESSAAIGVDVIGEGRGSNGVAGVELN